MRSAFCRTVPVLTTARTESAALYERGKKSKQINKQRNLWYVARQVIGIVSLTTSNCISVILIYFLLAHAIFSYFIFNSTVHDEGEK